MSEDQYGGEVIPENVYQEMLEMFRTGEPIRWAGPNPIHVGLQEMALDGTEAGTDQS